jgi:hypothetical protein
MRASLLCALCALGAAVPAPIKDSVLTITPPSADLAHDHPDGPTQGGATGANATDPEAPPETLTAKSEAGAAASPETHDATRAGATASASLIPATLAGWVHAAGPANEMAKVARQCTKGEFYSPYYRVWTDEEKEEFSGLKKFAERQGKTSNFGPGKPQERGETGTEKLQERGALAGQCRDIDWNCWADCGGSGPCEACGRSGGPAGYATGYATPYAMRAGEAPLRGCCQRGYANDHENCPADQKQYGHHTCVALSKKSWKEPLPPPTGPPGTCWRFYVTCPAHPEYAQKWMQDWWGYKRENMDPTSRESSDVCMERDNRGWCGGIPADHHYNHYIPAPRSSTWYEQGDENGVHILWQRPLQ